MKKLKDISAKAVRSQLNELIRADYPKALNILSSISLSNGTFLESHQREAWLWTLKSLCYTATFDGQTAVVSRIFELVSDELLASIIIDDGYLDCLRQTNAETTNCYIEAFERCVKAFPDQRLRLHSKFCCALAITSESNFANFQVLANSAHRVALCEGKNPNDLTSYVFCFTKPDLFVEEGKTPLVTYLQKTYDQAVKWVSGFDENSVPLLQKPLQLLSMPKSIDAIYQKACEKAERFERARDKGII